MRLPGAERGEGGGEALGPEPALPSSGSGLCKAAVSTLPAGCCASRNAALLLQLLHRYQAAAGPAAMPRC